MNDYAVSTETGTVRIERVLPGPIERVWAYLTEAEKRATWFAGGQFDLRKGGTVVLTFDHANLSSEMTAPERFKKESKATFSGVITGYEPPRLLSYTWGGGSENSEVTFELAPRGNDVLIVVTHRRLPNRSVVVNVSAGWDAHLGILADRLNGVEPRGFWTTHAKLEREYEARL